MPAEIVTGHFCAQYYATFKVPGSDGTIHTVTLNGASGMPHCGCPAYKYSRGDGKDCKHIRYVWDHACLWNEQWKDGGPNDIPADGIELYSDYPVIPGEECPACGGPVVPVRIAV